MMTNDDIAADGQMVVCYVKTDQGTTVTVLYSSTYIYICIYSLYYIYYFTVSLSTYVCKQYKTMPLTKTLTNCLPVCFVAFPIFFCFFLLFFVLSLLLLLLYSFGPRSCFLLLLCVLDFHFRFHTQKICTYTTTYIIISFFILFFFLLKLVYSSNKLPTDIQTFIHFQTHTHKHSYIALKLQKI